MLENVKLAGYTVPTPIQQYCMPAVKLGHDIVACAQTGKKWQWHFKSNFFADLDN
jgi:superfamily II DNA/RNA helicase